MFVESIEIDNVNRDFDVYLKYANNVVPVQKLKIELSMELETLLIPQK